MLPALALAAAAAAGGVDDFAERATLEELDAALAKLQAARSRRFPGAPTAAVPAAQLPMCAWEAPLTDQCVDPCPACLGYPSSYPENQTFHAWAVFSRPTTPWPARDIDTGLTGVDENPAAIGPGDEIVVQGSDVIYSSKDGGLTWGNACPAGTAFPDGWGDIGIGMADDGAILGAAQSGANIAVYRITRAANGSCAFGQPALLQAPVAGNTITDSPGRFVQDLEGDGTIYFAPQWLCNGAEGTVPRTGRTTECANGVLYASADKYTSPSPPPSAQPAGLCCIVAAGSGSGSLAHLRRGKSWSLRGYIGLSRDNSGGFVGTPLGDSCSEPDILPLGNGSILAACRYQNDPCSLVYYSSTSVTISHDKGKHWSPIGLLTGWAQQDGALVRLNDGTIAMPFAHKDK